jgi:two-component system nitrogen regulation sensor histidine kinase NtrY
MTPGPPKKTSRPLLWSGGLLIVLLLGAVFTLGSLNLPFEPRKGNDVLILFSLSVIIAAALLVLLLMMGRLLVRLWTERRARQLGARFKTKMVVGAMAISLLPVVFMFYTSYALLNLTLTRWFFSPMEAAAQESKKLITELGGPGRDRLNAYAQIAAQKLAANASQESLKSVLDGFGPGIDAILVLDSSGKQTLVSSTFTMPESPGWGPPVTLPSGAVVWKAGDLEVSTGQATFRNGSVLVMRRTTPDYVERFMRIQDDINSYDAQAKQYRAIRSQLLLVFSLFTLLLVFAVTWFAVYLSKQVTVPIQALAEGTREVSAGNFSHRVETPANDELGELVQSFNQMTRQLGDNRRQIDEFTRSLQDALTEIESRRKLIETVLENVPTGVISLDAQGSVVRMNSAAARMFGESARTAHTLAEIVGSEAGPEFYALLRRSSRLGNVSRAMDLRANGRVLHAAVTVSALGTRTANAGYIVVVDDLTELLRAQKVAAWQEVARRIAHEIKNPLTPIQLSADRLTRFLARRADGVPVSTRDTDLERVVSECATSIEREVSALKSLVEEFSQFVRFPQARLANADANSIVNEALNLFRGRLDGIQLRTDLAADLPVIKADAELLRGVLVNLIDNAAEAMENSQAKYLEVATRSTGHGDGLEIIVSDTGCGISPDDKDKLFLPHFSTKDRGTGLGLAIAARVVAEHHGTLRVEDNSPVGTRLVLRIPAAESVASHVVAEA